MRAALFSTWTAWDGVDVIRPLVRRPAHYHGLLVSLAAVNLLLGPERARRHWILAGLLLGLMAGFNYTLSATFGVAAVIATCLLFAQLRNDDARNLAFLTLFILLASLPVNAEMLRSGFHNMAPGFPFRGPNLEYPNLTWGALLSRMMLSSVVPWASLLLLPVAAYGIKLFGVGALAHLDLGEKRHHGLVMVLLITFGISFVVGTFFPYQGIPQPFICLQPTFWILGLFVLRPIHTWMRRGLTHWRTAVLCGILGLTWVQALASFNFSCKVVFSRDTADALQDVRLTAAPDEVVAYLPSDLTARPIWGHAEQPTNFSIIAMTGLDGYFSSAEYSRFNAVPGLRGRSPEEVLPRQIISINRDATTSSLLSKAASHLLLPYDWQRIMFAWSWCGGCNAECVFPRDALAEDSGYCHLQDVFVGERGSIQGKFGNSITLFLCSTAELRKRDARVAEDMRS